MGGHIVAPGTLGRKIVVRRIVTAVGSGWHVVWVELASLGIAELGDLVDSADHESPASDVLWASWASA